MTSKISPERKRRRAFSERLSERYGEPMTERMIALPDSVHNSIQAIGDATGTPGYELYTQAARMWLKERGVSSNTSKLGKLNAEEEHLLGQVLDLYKARQSSEAANNAINAIRMVIKASQMEA